MVLTTKGKVAIVLVVLAIVLAIVGIVYFVNSGSSAADDSTAAMVTLIQNYSVLLL